MRLLVFCILMLGGTWLCTAQVKTEKELVNNIIVAMQGHDDSSYAMLQPSFDLMWQQVLGYNDTSAYKMRRLANLQQDPKKLQQYDPRYNPVILGLFDVLIEKGADSGLHWSDILIARYELQKQRLPRGMEGLELVAPIRMNGFVFVQDVLTRKMFCIVLTDIFVIQDKWYGGRVINVLEAANIQEYYAKRATEEKEMQALYLAMQNGTIDSIIAVRDSMKKANAPFQGMYDDEDDEQSSQVRKEVVERKVYVGKLDNEIDIEIYIRGLKGKCPSTVCQWEAIYKFGDLDEYLLLTVERKPDGTFVLTEGEVGVMELQITNTGIMKGTWTSFKDGTGYEALLQEQKAIKGRVLNRLDNTMEDAIMWNQ